MGRSFSDLRRSERYQDLPVLMMSARAQKQDIIEATEVGINDFIAKPFTSAELKRKIFEVQKKQKEVTRKRQIGQIWEGRTTYLREMSSPHIIFGEPIDSLDELRDPANREVVTYLANASGAIAKANAKFPGLNAGYIIESQTSDLILHLKRRTAQQWVRGIFLSTRCRGNPTLIVRLFGINRRDDTPIFLIYDSAHDISAIHKRGLKKLGVQTMKRSSFDEERTRKLITKQIAASEKEEFKEEILSPEAIRGRVVQDIETMTSG